MHAHHAASFCSRLEEGINVLEHTMVPLRDSGVLSDAHEVVKEQYAANLNGMLLDQLEFYLATRSNLVDMYWNTAYECDIQQVWNEALFHCDKLMKVDADYDLPTRIRVPFILLYLNRDDEAYAFFRAVRNERAIDTSQPCLVEPNCRYLDLFKEIANSEEEEEEEVFYMHSDHLYEITSLYRLKE